MIILLNKLIDILKTAGNKPAKVVTALSKMTSSPVALAKIQNLRKVLTIQENKKFNKCETNSELKAFCHSKMVFEIVIIVL
jgi:hypothetical protein